MPLVALVVAYLIGGIPFGYLLVRLKTGEDVRSMGSGNIGATNVLRTSGRTVAVATLLLDLAKGFVAVWFHWPKSADPTAVLNAYETPP